MQGWDASQVIYDIRKVYLFVRQCLDYINVQQREMSHFRAYDPLWQLSFVRTNCLLEVSSSVCWICRKTRKSTHVWNLTFRWLQVNEGDLWLQGKVCCSHLHIKSDHRQWHEKHTDHKIMLRLLEGKQTHPHMQADSCLNWAQACMLHMLPNFTSLHMICSKTETPQTAELAIDTTFLFEWVRKCSPRFITWSARPTVT